MVSLMRPRVTLVRASWFKERLRSGRLLVRVVFSREGVRRNGMRE